MQLKGLVRFFAIALIVICVYQLSFTWFVRSHEKEMKAKAEASVKRSFPTANPDVDSTKDLVDVKYRRLLDSTKDSKIGLFGSTTYRDAKDKELSLGLDLQGGMSVTMEVGLDGLIKSLANYTKDAAFNRALEAAVAQKANAGADLVSLFIDSFKVKAAANANLASFFAARSSNKITFTSTDAEVKTYLKDKAKDAFENTVRILRTRIDRFGVASPNINPDPAKAIVNIELAGVNNPERVRNILTSTANLQFFEMYTGESKELGDALNAADKMVQDNLNGIKEDTTKAKDTSNKAAITKVDSAKYKTNEKPIFRYLQGGPQPYRDKAGKIIYPSAIAYVAVKDTGALNTQFRSEVVKNKFPGNLSFMYGKQETDKKTGKAIDFLALYAVKTLDNGQAELEGDHVAEARADYDERGNVIVRMNMDAVGTSLWGRMTTKNVGKPVAIVLDNIVYSAPNVNDAITTGSTQISGGFSLKEATDLSQILESGKLPAPAKIVQEQVVGPTLGHDAVNGGTWAFAISFLIIFGLMLVYYNTAGWVANIALILNLLFTIGVLAALGFTLTAPGIAGLVLTIGMAVDTNVIIFERIKEELNRGKGYAAAVNDGYKRSLAPVLDAHVTTFLTAFILFVFGLGPVLGFATTQMIGIILSLFCGILVSRVVTDIYTSRKDRHFEYFTAISRKVFKHASYKFIEYRKYAYMISVVVLIGGIGSFFYGFDEGVEFAGGRSYTIEFKENVSVDAVRDDLKKAFAGESPIIKTVGSSKQLNITTAYKIHETGKKVEDDVLTALYTGLQKHLPAGVSFAQFSTEYKRGSQTVLPSISADLKSGALKAGIIAILIICLYIFIRFRDWRYSLGTIVALLHDVFVTLAVFAFARKFVNFPLEIDQHFIAAVLTVIGFSMNDTVIVYDRIREDSRLYPDMGKEQVINTAINQTLSRTIMTSLTVFLTILILFFFGGEVTRGFAFAMLVGVITGTYSSIFVAAPILVDFAKSKPLHKGEKVAK